MVHPVGSAPRGRWWIGLTAAAGLVVVVTLVVGVVVAPETEPLAVESATDGGLESIAEAALDSLGLDGRSVLGLRDDLVAAFERRRPDLPVEAAGSVDDNLAMLDRTITELSEELRKQPNNQELARLLASAYRQQVEMLRRVERVGPRSMRAAHPAPPSTP